MINIHTKDWRKSLVIAFAMLIVGCQSAPEKNAEVESTDESVFRRGVLSIQNNQLMLKPCYVRSHEQVIDLTGKLEEDVKNTLGGYLYAELSGGMLNSDDPWEIRKVHLLGGNQLTCFYELQGNHYRAAGDSPVWIADVRKNGIFIKNFKDLSQLIFPLNTPTQGDDYIEWQSSIHAASSKEVSLRLLLQPCRDKHGIYYEYKAEMTLNGQDFKGCGRQGDLGQRTLPGLYRVTVPNLETPERQFSIELQEDGQVVLTQDYFNNQPLIIQTGTWELLPKNKVVIYLVAENNSNDNKVLLFDRHRLGGLVLQGYSSTFGKAGLTFLREGPSFQDVRDGLEDKTEHKDDNVARLKSSEAEAL